MLSFYQVLHSRSVNCFILLSNRGYGSGYPHKSASSHQAQVFHSRFGSSPSLRGSVGVHVGHHCIITALVAVLYFLLLMHICNYVQ